MKLKDSLYTVVSQEERIFSIKLNPDHVIYKAHFPEQPITPGVCILQIGLELLTEELKQTLRLSKVHNIKFVSVLSPVADPQVNFQFTQINPLDDKQIKAQISVLKDDLVFAKISLTAERQ